ncbi:inner nuclear membrane protein Man1 [Venturia canescens]|uniref:inner nuclear membrane protein Man1 n=1 Tax=Venturia canescens TaxID=32260 RepID=UPI001C9D5589|nr:inner nuclear membrane protein Man1 [Venturia canescens]
MSVDSLTDSELRTKLAEYGYPVGPVTQTTRKILAKKLKNLMDSRGGAGSRHSLAARYSSDETDDDTVLNANKKKKTVATSARRQTMANPMPPSSPSLASATGAAVVPRSPNKRKTQASRNTESKEIAESQDETPSSSSSTRSITKSVTKKITSKTYKTSSGTDGLETGSDSDLNDDTTQNYYSNKWYNTKNQDRSSAEAEQKSTEVGNKNLATSKSKKYPAVPPFKPDISPILPVREETTYKKNDLATDNLLANFETPFLSDFTRRLSSRSSMNLPSPSRSTLKSSILRPSGVPETKDGDTNGHFSTLRSTYSVPSTSSRFVGPSNDRPCDTVNRFFKLSANGKEDVRNNHNLISMVLLIVLATFFGVLAVMYLGLGGKTDNFPALPTDSNVPLCLMSDHDKPGVNCLLKENLENVIQLLQKLRPILMRKAVNSVCEDTGELPYLTDNEIIHLFRNDKATKLEITSDLHNAQLLIFGNPKWGISLIEIGDENGHPYQVLDSMEKVFQIRLDSKLGMIISSPDLPMKCLIKQKLFMVFSTILIIVIGIALSLGGRKIVLWYLQYKKSAEREIFRLVSKIISMVEMHHQNACTSSPGGTQESYLAINHVRDNLIPPKDRKKMAALWEKAVKFLDENESRIRREVQQVAGEEFHVWRWLPNNTMNTSNSQSSMASKKSKVWQGQAFEMIEGSVNSLTWSPTPCLKIRHMFDPDVEFEENWETKVQDAILEKCGEAVKILHIRVDRGSREGCVYMKCLSQEDAGKACRSLHGCWFDGKLVTVKYLRLQRYHERFPDAARCTTPVKPSNNERLSMQAQPRLTSLEAN